jgi:uncharacterized membrane protein YkvI
MNYKIATILLFVVMMLLVILLIFSETQWGLAIMGIVIPLLVVLQVLVILRAKEQSGEEYSDGKYDKE